MLVGHVEDNPAICCIIAADYPAVTPYTQRTQTARHLIQHVVL